MRTWQVRDAKARFSELLEACLKDGPQIVTKRGIEAAVLVPVEEWRRFQGGGRPGPQEPLRAEGAGGASTGGAAGGDSGAAARPAQAPGSAGRRLNQSGERLSATAEGRRRP